MNIFKQIQWGLITFLVALLLYTVTFGAENLRHVTLLEYFGQEATQRFEAQRKISKLWPELFTADFYKLNENSQMERADYFWKNRIQPLAKYLDASDQAAIKVNLVQGIHRLNNPPVNPTAEKNKSDVAIYLDALKKEEAAIKKSFNTSPPAQPAQK